MLLRKGGIREPTFTPKAQRFLLFPTAFHSDAQLLKPGVAEQFQQVRLCVGGDISNLARPSWDVVCMAGRGQQAGASLSARPRHLKAVAHNTWLASSSHSSATE